MSKPKLRDVQDKLVEAVSEGATLREAASLAGISYETLRRWLKRREAPYVGLVSSLDEAAQQASQHIIRGSARSLRRAREEKEDEFSLTTRYLNEILRIQRDGRVPLDCAIKGLEMALDELNSIRLEESVSWAENPERAKCFGLERGKSA